jgi:hypothetical protein
VDSTLQLDKQIVSLAHLVLLVLQLELHLAQPESSLKLVTVLVMIAQKDLNVLSLINPSFNTAQLAHTQQETNNIVFNAPLAKNVNTETRLRISMMVSSLPLALLFHSRALLVGNVRVTSLPKPYLALVEHGQRPDKRPVNHVSLAVPVY